MTRARHRTRLAVLAAVVTVASVSPRAAGQDQAAVLALIRAAVVDRMGEGVDVAVTAVDGLDAAAARREFRSARPDPSARLGRPIRVTLVPAQGQAVIVTATVRVISDRVVARRAVGRGATIEPGDVERVREELTDTPIRRLPTLEQVTGARALRPFDAGATVLPGFVVVPRAIEAGDRVLVVAAIGAVEVSATFVAADGGVAGDLIRVMNPDTRRYVRGRIVKKGLVEVIYEK